MMKIGYIGWYGHNNLGDDLPYQMFCRVTRSLGMQSKFGVEGVQKVIMGCGTLIDTKYNEFMKQAASCMNRNVPLYIVGTGVEYADGCKLPMEFIVGRPERKDVLKRVIDYAKEVSVRGEESKRILEGLTNNHDIKVCGDFGFLMDWDKDSAAYDNSTIMVNYGTSWGYLYGGEENKAYDLYKEVILKLKNNFKIVVVPFWTNDIPICCKLAEDCAVEGINKVPLENELFGILENVKTVIGFKLHSLVFSYCAERCIVPVAYRHKSIDFLTAVGFTEKECIKINDENFVAKVLESVINYERAYDFKKYLYNLEDNLRINRKRLYDNLSRAIIGRLVPDNVFGR